MTTPEPPAPACRPAAGAGLPARIIDLAAAQEDQAAAERRVAEGMDDRGDRMFLAGQATARVQIATALRNLARDHKETSCNPE